MADRIHYNRSFRFINALKKLCSSHISYQDKTLPNDNLVFLSIILKSKKREKIEDEKEEEEGKITIGFQYMTLWKPGRRSTVLVKS